MSDLFPFLYFGVWWLVGGGFLVIMSELGMIEPALTTVESYALSTHGFAFGLVVCKAQAMGVRANE